MQQSLPQLFCWESGKGNFMNRRNYLIKTAVDGLDPAFSGFTRHAKNISPGKETSEFAGAAFSPDGKTLFVNIQTAGSTAAISGDWGNFKA